MSFIVNARTGAGQVSFERDSMLSALEQALTMSAAGMQGVVIVDSLGARHTPAEVSRSLLAAWGGGKGGDAIRVKRAA